jgi:hypothetical protein
MLEAFSTPHNRTMTVVFLAACAASAIAAVAVTVSDNPPGLLLAFLAAAAFILAFAHPWRTARPFRLLFYGSVLGVVFFAVLHNVFEAMPTAGGLHSLLQAVSVAAFFLAVFLFPPAFLIGTAGWVAMGIRNRRRPA